MGWLITDRPRFRPVQRVGYFGYFGRELMTSVSRDLAPAPAPAPAPVPTADSSMLATSQPLTIAPTTTSTPTATFTPTRYIAPAPAPVYEAPAPAPAPTYEMPRISPKMLVNPTLIGSSPAPAPVYIAPAPAAPIDIAREIAKTAAVMAATPARNLPQYVAPSGNPYATSYTAEPSVNSDGTFVPAGTPVASASKPFPWWLLLLGGYAAYRYSKKGRK